MATIKIKSKDENLFVFELGKIKREEPRNYHAKQTVCGDIRAEMVGDEQSDLFNPIHFSKIEVDGKTFDNANDAVTALNKVIYNDVASGGGTDKKLNKIIDLLKIIVGFIKDNEYDETTSCCEDNKEQVTIVSINFLCETNFDEIKIEGTLPLSLDVEGVIESRGIQTAIIFDKNSGSIKNINEVVDFFAEGDRIPNTNTLNDGAQNPFTITTTDNRVTNKTYTTKGSC